MKQWKKKKKKNEMGSNVKLLELQLHWFSKYSGQKHRTKEWLKYSGREVLIVKSGRMQEREKTQRDSQNLAEKQRKLDKIRGFPPRSEKS